MTTCAESDCGHTATHAIKLCVPATGWPQDEARALSMLLDVRLCRRHAESFTPEQLLDVPNERGATVRDELIPALARMKRLTIPPDPARAWIVPLRLESKAYRTLQSAIQKSGKPPP